MSSPERPSTGAADTTSTDTTSVGAATAAAGPSTARIAYGNNFSSAEDSAIPFAIPSSAIPFFHVSMELGYSEESAFVDLVEMGFDRDATRVILDSADGDQVVLFRSLLEQLAPAPALHHVRQLLAKAEADVGQLSLDMARDWQRHPLTEGQLLMGVGLPAAHPAHRLNRKTHRLEAAATAFPAWVDPVAHLRRAVKKWLRAASYLESLGEDADESLLRSAVDEESSSRCTAEALNAQFEP